MTRPDFGTAVHNAIGSEPFELTIFSSNDPVFVVYPTEGLISVSLLPTEWKVEPGIVLTEPHLLSIEVEESKPSKTLAERWIAQRMGKPIKLSARHDKGYEDGNGEWVVPCRSLEVRQLTEGDRDALSKAEAKRQRKAQKWQKKKT